jgi:S-adenosylmethionine hydrolase
LADAPELTVRRLDRPGDRQPPAGLQDTTTFDGRDLFAPVAARLATGTPLAELGSPALAADLGEAATLRPRNAEATEGSELGWIVWIDRFGNAITDLSRETAAGRGFGDHAQIEVAGHRIDGPYRSFTAGPADRVFWLWGSGGTLEIAARDQSAAERLNLRRGLAIRAVTR